MAERGEEVEKSRGARAVGGEGRGREKREEQEGEDVLADSDSLVKAFPSVRSDMAGVERGGDE